MFDTVFGLPTHPLVVHFAVASVPVAAILAVLHAWWGAKRSAFVWPTSIALVVAALSSFIAAGTGEELEERLEGPAQAAMAAGEMTAMETHAGIGDTARIVIVLFCLVAGAFIYLASTRGPSIPKQWFPIAQILVTVFAVAALVAIVMAGHSGAEAAWGHITG